MIFKNLSSYPTDEVRALVRYGMKGVDTVGLPVTAHDYHGHPSEGLRGLTASMRNFLTGEVYNTQVHIGVDDPDVFPVNNIVTDDGCECGMCEASPYVGIPYGGKWENYIETRNWREAFVRTAAHEAYHVKNHKEGHVSFESILGGTDFDEEADAEAYAKQVLEQYRKEKGE